MEVTINQVILHLLDPGASEPMLSDRAMEMDADLFEYFTAVLEKAFASDEVKNCRFLPDSAFAAEMRWRVGGKLHERVGCAREIYRPAGNGAEDRRGVCLRLLR